MFKNKTGNDRRVEMRQRNVLRMLRSEDAFESSPASMEATCQDTVCEDSQKAVRTAMLEAEYRKAKALMAFRSSARFC